MKNITKTLTAIILILLLSNCTWVGTRKNIRTFDERGKISTQDSFYLIYPKNGFEKKMFSQNLQENPDSAKEVIDVLRSGLPINLGELSISDKNIDLEEGFRVAKLKGSKYLIDITINEWKDAFYAMCAPYKTGHNPSLEPSTLDTVDLTIFVYNVQNKSLTNKQKIENRGCPIVISGIIPLGKNTPSSRLESMIPDWLENLRM